MKLPIVISDLIAAQDKFDSAAYADCFSETGVMFDEGKTHTGREEISKWIKEGNEKYHTVMKPLSFDGDAKTGLLKAEVSGTFPGSPLDFTYIFEFDGALIQSLRIALI